MSQTSSDASAAKSSQDGGLQLRPGAGNGAQAMPKINPLAGAKVAPPVITAAAMKPSASCGSLDSLDKINVLKKNIVRRTSVHGSQNSASVAAAERARSSLSQTYTGDEAKRNDVTGGGAFGSPALSQPRGPTQGSTWNTARRHTVVGAPGERRRSMQPDANFTMNRLKGNMPEPPSSMRNTGRLANIPSNISDDSTAGGPALTTSTSVGNAVNGAAMGSPQPRQRTSSGSGDGFFFSRSTTSDNNSHSEEADKWLRGLDDILSPPSSPRSPIPQHRTGSVRSNKDRPLYGGGDDRGSWRTPPQSPLSRRNTVAGLPRDPSLLRKLLSEPRQTPDGEVKESLLDIRSRIQCKLFDFGDGVCPYGDKCHYRHALRDGTLVKPDYVDNIAQALAEGTNMPSLADLRSQIPCRLFNYGEGSCEYGVSCYYKHCDKQGRMLERTGQAAAAHRLRFQNPYGVGDICAAGIIPYTYKGCEDHNGDAVWALLQIEDIRVEGTKKWKRGLAMFGGKVQQEDADWLETAAREFAEETGGLLGVFKPLQNLCTGVPMKIYQVRIEGDSEAGSYTKYLSCKYQVLHYPIDDSEYEDFLRLPQAYWEKFQGQPSRDWSRAAIRLEPVLLRKYEAVKDVLDAVYQKEDSHLSMIREDSGSVKSLNLDQDYGATSEEMPPVPLEIGPGCSSDGQRRSSTDREPDNPMERARRNSGSESDDPATGTRLKRASSGLTTVLTEKRKRPTRGWVVFDLNTGLPHELPCSVQLRQALEVAEFPKPLPAWRSWRRPSSEPVERSLTPTTREARGGGFFGSESGLSDNQNGMRNRPHRQQQLRTPQMMGRSERDGDELAVESLPRADSSLDLRAVLGQASDWAKDNPIPAAVATMLLLLMVLFAQTM